MKTAGRIWATYSYSACLYLTKEGSVYLEKEALPNIYARHMQELDEQYVRKDPGYQMRETELREAVHALEPLMKLMGDEIWQKFDRILTAYNRCEAYVQQLMYAKGAMDAITFMALPVKEELDGRD